ncbi:hypothetical protein AB0L47_25095 [Streptomyces bobili]|uniref:hypothetical protein n=1 Tax=Streptomyces bobili TaxID=67280 RepID=UPI00343A1026
MDDEQRMNLAVLPTIPRRYAEGRLLRAPQSAGFDDWTLARCRAFQRITPNGSGLIDLADQAQTHQTERQHTG